MTFKIYIFVIKFKYDKIGPVTPWTLRFGAKKMPA